MSNQFTGITTALMAIAALSAMNCSTAAAALSAVCSRGATPADLKLPSSTPPEAAKLPSEKQQLEDYRSANNQAIIRFISTIENGPSFSYDAVTGNFDGEGLSIGLIQFNFGGDAQVTFGDIDKQVFVRHMPGWGELFYRAVHTDNSKNAIALVVQMQSQSDKTWRVKPDALTELRAFLSSPESKNAQDKRVAYEFAKALSRAKQWAMARGETAPSNREIANFFDNQVFSGGALNGVWLTQAKAFRAKFSSDAEMASFIANWLKSCPAKGPKALYGAAEGAANGEIWSQKLAAGAKLSESQSLLFSLGFVRGLAAVGPADDPSQAGVFKSQVISRRGLIATSWGTANGVPWPGGPLDR
jgi:hypothetical protein